MAGNAKEEEPRFFRIRFGWMVCSFVRLFFFVFLLASLSLGGGGRGSRLSSSDGLIIGTLMTTGVIESVLEVVGLLSVFSDWVR